MRVGILGPILILTQCPYEEGGVPNYSLTMGTPQYGTPPYC